MPKRAQYIVRWSQEQRRYFLIDSENDGEYPLLEDEESWLKWVQDHRAFAFHGRHGNLNLLKERRSRGGEGYWYAYQRREGRMIKRYVGGVEQLHLGYLEEIAASLVGVAGENNTSHPSYANPVQFEPLLLPKLQLPRPQKSHLLRERLLKLLDASLEHKLTILAGPAGYGKTTLIGQWVAQRSTHQNPPRVASVTLDEGDNDPLRFWHYMITACQQLLAGSSREANETREALELLQAHRLPPFKPLEMMLTSLLNELSRLEHPTVLILDDFHTVNSPGVVETLTFFLDHLPTSFHLIMLIRGDPPFSLTRLRARSELLDIYPSSLAFSSEETSAFFEQELSFSLPLSMLRQINERMDGWPVGLRLLAKDLQGADGTREIEQMLAAFTGNHWSIQDYFLGEVLCHLTLEQQEFLLQTSILPRFTASLCDAITGRTDSTSQLALLRGSDLFLVPLDGIGEWTRYQSLFADAMRLKARRRLGDECLRQFAARASIWYEEHGLLVEAIETALNATEFQRAASLIERFSISKQRGSVSTIPELYSLNRWLEQLPPEELESNPDLCIQYALTLLFLQAVGQRTPSGRACIHHLLQSAEQRWRDVNNTAKLAEIFAFRALLARQEGHLLQAVTWAKQSLAWLPQEDRNWHNLSLSVVGVGELLDGNAKDGSEFLLEALMLAEQQGNHIYARAIRGMLAWASMEQGELRSAAEQLLQMQAEARAQGDRDDVARTQLSLAQIEYQWNNLDDAERAAHEALTFGEQMNVEELEMRAAASLALIEHARGQSDQALQRLTARLARVQTSTSPASYQLYRELQAMQVRIQLANGDLATVRRWFASSERREETLPLLQRQREQLLQARLLLAQGESARAIEMLQSLETTALQTDHGYFRLEVQVVLVRAYSRQGAQEKARKLLRELLETTRGEGYLRLFLDEGQEMADLLRKLLPYLHEKALLAYARRILSAFARESNAVDLTPGSNLLLEPLSPQEQKVLRLLAAGNSNIEIARVLVVSVNTVRTQVQSIYRKLNVNNRVEASAMAKMGDA